jgi:hypothetical protein
MAYLYTSSRLDSAGNLEKARATMKQVLADGGKARFFVGRARDKKKEKHLVEATPGELIVTGSYVEFEPQDGSDSKPERWEKKDITRCELNPGYGKSSNSFHITLGKVEHDFRPLHFSAEESNLICSLIGVSTPAAKKR